MRHVEGGGGGRREGKGRREMEEGGRGEEGESAGEEESSEGFRGMMDGVYHRSGDLQLEQSLLLAFKLSSSLPVKFGFTRVQA